MSASAGHTHRVFVESDVFAAIWSARQPGEETENDILRRICGLAPTNVAAQASAPISPVLQAGLELQGSNPPGGRLRLVHREGECDFPEGFEIVRSWKGEEFHAFATTGGWRLLGDARLFASLSALSRRVGAGSENVWMAWRFRNRAGKWRPLDEYRRQASG